jgi:hypothetical protein
MCPIKLVALSRDLYASRDDHVEGGIGPALSFRRLCKQKRQPEGWRFCCTVDERTIFVDRE